MNENKTKPNTASVAAFLAAIEGDERRNDCEALLALMRKVTGKPAVLWGSSIIGFDAFHYKYASGHEGDMAVTGFSPRKAEISIYLTAPGADQADLLAQLGRHKMGKACLYIRKLSDIDLTCIIHQDS